jgi:hypothetical protein
MKAPNVMGRNRMHPEDDMRIYDEMKPGVRPRVETYFAGTWLSWMQ